MCQQIDMTQQAKPDILILTHEYPPFRGGVGTYCEQLAAAATRLGRKVTLWAPGFGVAKESPSAKFKIERFRGGVFKHWQFPYILLLTLKAVLTHRNSIILAADWPFVAACGLLRRIIPFRYRIMLHGSEILFLRTSRLLNLITLGDPFYKADLICTNSNFTRGLLLQTYPGVPQEKALVTYLGMDGFWLNEKPKADAALLKRLGVPAGNKVVLSVGRLHPRKGQARTLAALSTLPAALRKTVTYVMVGNAVDEAYHQELTGLVANANFNAIIASGLSNEEVRSLYQSATVFCVPSTTKGTKVEGFGLVFLEAAGSSLPSIAVAAAAVPEVVKDGETGLLVASDDEKDLAPALQKILSDDKLRTRLGTNAQKWARNFTWERCATETFGAL